MSSMERNFIYIKLIRPGTSSGEVLRKYRSIYPDPIYADQGSIE